jgi:hypothetical protein
LYEVCRFFSVLSTLELDKATKYLALLILAETPENQPEFLFLRLHFKVSKYFEGGFFDEAEEELGSVVDVDGYGVCCYVRRRWMRGRFLSK